jgi:hypothetical protein
MMPDGSDSIFNGRPKGNAIEGSYLCLQGGGLIERGIASRPQLLGADSGNQTARA